MLKHSSLQCERSLSVILSVSEGSPRWATRSFADAQDDNPDLSHPRTGSLISKYLL